MSVSHVQSRWIPLLALAFALGHAGWAAGAGLGWSEEVPPGSTGGSAVRATAIACPLATQCTAVSTQGEEVTFSPQEPSLQHVSRIDWGRDTSDIACPAASQCTAVDNAGSQLTFDPAEPAGLTSWPASNVSLFAVACPSLAECVGVGNPQMTAVTFDPTGAPPLHSLEIEHRDGLGHVSCPAASQCTATSLGNEITFDPLAPASAALVPTGSEGWINGIACPTVHLCVAVEFDGQEITFDPSTPSSATAHPIGIATPWSVACPSTEQCTAVGEYETSTFDPLDPARPPVSLGGAGGFASAIACPEPTQCTVVAGLGETTFNPQASPQIEAPPPATSPPGTAETERRGGGTRSRIGLLGKTAVVSGRHAVIPVECIGSAACSIELTLASSLQTGVSARLTEQPLVLGSARGTIGASQHAKVAIALTGIGRRLLRAHRGRMPAQLVLNGRGGSSLIHTTARVRLRVVTR